MTETISECIKVLMSEHEGKKNETVTVKVSIEQLKEFDEIAKRTDRSRSYVVRELAIRGMELYKQDGLLKEIADTSFQGKLSKISTESEAEEELVLKKASKIGLSKGKKNFSSANGVTYKFIEEDKLNDDDND